MYPLKKVPAEARLRKAVTYLGWFYNLQTLCISLPLAKFEKCTRDIDTLLTKYKKAEHEEMESLACKLNHVVYVIPRSRYFLNTLCKHVRDTRERPVQINKEQLADQIEWRNHFLRSAVYGLSIN